MSCSRTRTPSSRSAGCHVPSKEVGKSQGACFLSQPLLLLLLLVSRLSVVSGKVSSFWFLRIRASFRFRSLFSAQFQNKPLLST